MSAHSDPESPTSLTADHFLASTPLSAWILFRVWFVAGGQSFGGGVATLALIRRAVVEEHQWLTSEEFTRYWALCQMAPGINLFALAILIGRRLGGIKGILLALWGLILPSVTIALLITALFAGIQRLELTQAALRGIIPATVGLGLLTAMQIARPLLTTSRKEGFINLSWSMMLLMGSGLAVLLARWPVILVLCISGLLGALFSWWRHRMLRGIA
jgi:chromate transporter